jgi:malate synthase
MGVGAAAIYNLMEDAATAEISRTQVWQWLKNEAFLNDERKLTREMILQWEFENWKELKNMSVKNVSKTENLLWQKNFLTN